VTVSLLLAVMGDPAVKQLLSVEHFSACWITSAG